MELCLPEEMGKGAGELFLSPGSSSSPLSLLRDSEKSKTWCMLFGLYFFGFLSFCGEFLLEMWV